jgi:hypothetical protein
MDPELKQAHADVTELMKKVHPMFHGVNSFVVMMTLADLIAQWVLSHPFEMQPRMVASLIATAHDRVGQLLDDQDEETRH